MSATRKSKRAPALPPQAQAGIVYAVLMLAFMGQMLLGPILAPLSRDMGLAEWHIGATISLAAVVLALASPLWGVAAQKLGAKPVLAASMTAAALALAAFALVARAGIHGTLSGTPLVLAVMGTRGLFYGLAIAAVSPTVQTHLVTHTTTEAERLKATGGMGAITALSSIIGAILGGALAAAGGLMLPLAVMPTLIVAGLIVLITRFHPQAGLKQASAVKKLSYADPRILPFLLLGLALFVVFSTLLTLFGFLIQDRSHYDAGTTAAVTAIYMVGISVAMIIAQAALAPALKWGSVTLLRRGMIIALAGLLLLIPDGGHILMAIGSSLFGIGAGLAMPGYNAGPTMTIADEEQGSLAGLINANNGLAYAIAPIGATALYGAHHNTPLWVAVLLLAAAVAFSYVHPGLRRAAKPQRSPQQQAAET